MKLLGRKQKTPSLLINFVLDKSTSMASVEGAVISGFNEFKNDQAKAGETFFSLTTFDTQSQVLYTNEPVKNVDDLNGTTYIPGGMTALYDAVGMAIKALDDNPPTTDKVLFVIYTDGQENSSREYNAKAVHDLIADRRKEKEWEFVFLGADQDAWTQGATVGVASRAHTMSVNNTALGVTKGFQTLSSASTRYRTSSTSTMDAYFTEEELDQRDAK